MTEAEIHILHVYPLIFSLLTDVLLNTGLESSFTKLCSWSVMPTLQGSLMGTFPSNPSSAHQARPRHCCSQAPPLSSHWIRALLLGRPLLHSLSSLSRLSPSLKEKIKNRQACCICRMPFSGRQFLSFRRLLF